MMNKLQTTFRLNKTSNATRGFALLYTVIVVTLILSIAISISNITYKQSILSGLAKDSQIAFYQADAGAECGLYQDIVVKRFPFGLTLATAQTTQPTIDCGDTTLSLASGSSDGYFVYNSSGASASTPCFSIVFDKRDPAQVATILESRGHNLCGAGPRQVERAVQLRY